MSITRLKNIIVFVGLLFVLIIIPIVTYSVEEVPSGGTGIVYYCKDGNCDFQDLVNAVVKVTKFAATITLSLSVVAIAFAGYKYMISGDNPGERASANKMLMSVAKGIAFILAAWLIVTLITNALLNPNIIKFGM